MATRPLDALDSVDPREAWDHEAHDFTPWLADNLDRLAKEIGIELEHERTEMPVGPLRADIVARNPRDDSRVLIENQLEHADLHHLGQVLAYLAGLEAKAVVWVAKGFDEPHLSALRWLNEHTGESFAFFAVRVRVVRIGDSPLAPVFEVLERPNDWDRRVQETVQHGELSELGQFRRDFWAHVSKRHEGEAPAGWARSNVYHRVEEAGRRVCQYVAVHGVGVYFTRERESEEEYLAAVAPSVKWLRDETKGAEMSGDAGGLSFLKIDSRDRNNWDQMAKWLHERRMLCERALRDGAGAEVG